MWYICNESRRLVTTRNIHPQLTSNIQMSERVMGTELRTSKYLSPRLNRRLHSLLLILMLCKWNARRGSHSLFLLESLVKRLNKLK